MRLISDRTFERARSNAETIEDLRLEPCQFTQGSARDTTFRRIELVDCRCWAAHLFDPVLEDCTVTGLRMSLGPGGGRTQPLFVWGGWAKHLTLSGRIGGLVWNPPVDWRAEWDLAGLQAVRRAYVDVDWALDIRNAEFTAVPGFRFGPPGRLIRRDEETQPLVTRKKADTGSWRERGGDIGVWRIALDDLLAHPWPDEIVLVPQATGPRRADQLRAIQRLRDLRVAE
ncbi:MAG TPA: hypothetical protein VF998_09505 [Candidatus Limnocylindria bacterium]